MKIKTIIPKKIQETEYGLEHWLAVTVIDRNKTYQVHQLVLTTGFLLPLNILENIIYQERKEEIKEHIKIIQELEQCSQVIPQNKRAGANLHQWFMRYIEHYIQIIYYQFKKYFKNK